MRTLKVLALLVAVAIVVQAVGVAPVQAQGNVIKIASQSPLSGGQSVLGVGLRNGTELAINQLKKPIEDMGFKVEFVPFDDQAKPDVGVANAQNIVNDAAILAVIGHFNSGVAIPSSEVYAKSDLVMVSPANTNVKVTDRGLPNVNRVCGRDDAQGAAGANYAVKELKVKSVYVLHDKTAYGEGVATAFRDAIKSMGVDVLGFEGTEEKSNFDAILTPIAAQNPDLIYFGGIYDQVGVFLKQARDKGIKSQFMGPDGWDSPDLAKLGGDAAVGAIYTSTAGPISVYPAAKQLLTDYKATYGIDATPYVPESYAATQIVLHAIETVLKANGGKMPTRKEVSEAVRATKDFDTVAGKITFDAHGDPVYAAYYVLKATSADPAKWSENPVLQTTTAPSPLTAQAMASATMAATSTK